MHGQFRIYIFFSSLLFSFFSFSVIQILQVALEEVDFTPVFMGNIDPYFVDQWYLACIDPYFVHQWYLARILSYFNILYVRERGLNLFG